MMEMYFIFSSCDTYSIASRAVFPVRNTFYFTKNGFNMTKIYSFLCGRVLEKGATTSYGSYVFEHLWVVRPVPLRPDSGQIDLTSTFKAIWLHNY